MANELANITLDSMTTGALSTVATDSFEGSMKVANAINDSISLAEYVQQNDNPVMNVTDIIITPGIRKSRDPRLDDTECEDTRLILADGTSLLSQSSGIAKSARFIVGFLGASLHDGILMQVSETRLSNGNTIKNLKVIGQA